MVQASTGYGSDPAAVAERPGCAPACKARRECRHGSHSPRLRAPRAGGGVRVPVVCFPRPGLKRAVVFLEWLAKKEPRDSDRQQRFLGVAGFYRPLAGIFPAMPTQYKIKVGPSLTRAERWHARAEE